MQFPVFGCNTTREKNNHFQPKILSNYQNIGIAILKGTSASTFTFTAYFQLSGFHVPKKGWLGQAVTQALILVVAADRIEDLYTTVRGEHY